MSIKIVNGLAQATPHWHMQTVDGQPVFRLRWEKYDDKQYAEDTNIEGVLRYELFYALARMLTDTFRPRISLRDLTGKKWWGKRGGAEGVMKELIYEAPMDSKVLLARADREASVALTAIEAYRAYVANGGNPLEVPALSYKDDRFNVEMKNPDDI